jgi:hypothetical protein
MRLTLRTLLAYLDNVLDPADAEVLGRKIRDSEFATGLVQRIHGVLRKLRMDAPRLDGKGLGNDPNTVAEYLDSTLPQDRVSDFERVCLESDKHLCEVAACHQILALVLGRPAEVPPELREKIYALGDPERMVPAAAAAPPAAEAPPPPPVAKVNGQPADRQEEQIVEIPEYLRRQSGPSLPLLAASAVVAMLLGIGVLRLLGPFTAEHPLARLWQRQAVAEAKPAEARPGEASAAREPQEGAKAAAVDGGVRKTTPADRGTAGKASPPSAAGPVISGGEGLQAKAASDVTPEVAGARPSVSPEHPSPVPGAGLPAGATAGQGPGAEEQPSAGTRLDRTVPPAPPPVATSEEAPQVAATPAAEGGKAVGVPSPPASGTAGQAPPAAAAPAPPPATAASPPEATKEPREVGRYTSDGQLLAVFEPAEELWYLKQTSDVLIAGERLVVLPTFRPQIALPSAVQLLFAGEGALQMLEPGEDQVPRVAIEYGRIRSVTAGKAGAAVELDLAGISGRLTLADADSAVAIRVTRWAPPGSDPRVAEGMPVVELYNLGGRAQWQPSGGSLVEIPPRHVRLYVGVEPPQTLGPFQPPEWVDARSVPPIDRQAATVLERALDVARPLNLSLQEMTKDRRVEVRSLAARALAALDDFDAVIRELNDSRQYSFWSADLEALRLALARGPETAAKVYETLKLLRGTEADDLFRLLWGYSPEQLARGGAAQLVRYLEHESMDVRVLAFLNLQAITGKTEFYRPDRPLNQPQTRTAIQNWKQLLEKGQIVYRTPPTPHEPYRPLGPAEARPALPMLPMR